MKKLLKAKEYKNNVDKLIHKFKYNAFVAGIDYDDCILNFYHDSFLTVQEDAIFNGFETELANLSRLLNRYFWNLVKEQSKLPIAKTALRRSRQFSR